LLRLVLVLICLTACKQGRNVSPFTLRVAVSGSLDRLGPDTTTPNRSALAQDWVYEPLGRFDAAGDFVPVLASKLEMAGKGEVRVWLRADARFSDGTPLTFEDVSSSLERIGLRARRDGESILVDSADLSLPPDVLLPFALVFRAAGQRPLGTGPFIVEEEDSSHLLLSRRKREPGMIDRVLLQAYPLPKDAFAHMLKGDADLLPEAETRWLEFFEGVPRLRIVRSPGTHANVVAFNLRRLSRLERVALTHVLASNEVRKLAFGNSCPPHDEAPGAEPLPPGESLNVVALPVFERFALVIRRALGERGGGVRLADLQGYFAIMKDGDFDIVAAAPLIWPPVMSVLYWRTGAPSNKLGYSNPRVDAALDARDWRAAKRALDEDPPAAFVCNPDRIAIVDARIKNAELGPYGLLETLPQWEVAQ
jgi:hypothetical protein